MVFYDSWELAGDGSAGHTWSNRNPLAAVSLYPDRRPPGDNQISDHYGLIAHLRS
jgi:hypothetical protein